MTPVYHARNASSPAQGLSQTRFIDRDEVARRLTYDLCIPIVRQAMVALSKRETKQLLRSILPLSQGRLFGVMPGALGARAPFGANVLSVFEDNAARGRPPHRGLVLLFDPDTGAPGLRERRVLCFSGVRVATPSPSFPLRHPRDPLLVPHVRSAVHDDERAEWLRRIAVRL
jgi:hypothetical protein